MDINVALLADEKTNGKLLAVSQRLVKEVDSAFGLDRLDARSHITLYMTGYPDNALPEIQARTSRVAGGRPAPHVQSAGWRMTEQGTLLLEIVRTPELDDFHRSLVEALSPLRDGARAEVWEQRRDRFDELHARLLDDLGMPYVLGEWRPHFTLGKIEPERCEQAAGILAGVEVNFYPIAVGIGHVGPHGTFRDLEHAIRF